MNWFKGQRVKEQLWKCTLCVCVCVCVWERERGGGAEGETEHHLKHLPPGVLNHYLTHANLLSLSHTHTAICIRFFFVVVAVTSTMGVKTAVPRPLGACGEEIHGKGGYLVSISVYIWVGRESILNACLIKVCVPLCPTNALQSGSHPLLQ